MSETAENLWGELPVVEGVETPLSILRSQASILNKLSKGLLDGWVVRSAQAGNDLGYELRIRVPSLGNYSISILTVKHPVELYPAVVFPDLNDMTADAIADLLNIDLRMRRRGVKAGNAEELRTVLKTFLQSEGVRRVVTALLAQANDHAVEV